MTARRTAHLDRGQRAEWLAAAWLVLKGYRILARNRRAHRTGPLGEIDIVARRGAVLAFVEVKARPTLDTALLAVHPRQRHRIERAAAAYVAQRPTLQTCRVRFDVVAVMPGRRPHHLVDAWRP